MHSKTFDDICRKCDFYTDQKDRNGDIAITYCVNHENESDYEGNTTYQLCPIKDTFDKPKG